MIELKNIVKEYNKIKIINKFNYVFESKGLYIISGVSGCGKTTLLNIIASKDNDYTGKRVVKGDIYYLRDAGNLVSSLSVKDNFFLLELVTNKKIVFYFDIKEIMNKKVKKLSLGEKQLVELTIALNSNSSILVLDEPFSAISQKNKKLIKDVIEEIGKEKLVIISSHEYTFFDNYTLIDLNKKNHSSSKLVMGSLDEKTEKSKFKKEYYLFYFKKSIWRYLVLVFSLFFCILNYISIRKYSENMINEANIHKEDGYIVSKTNEIAELNDNLFYEIIKLLSTYVVNYNGSYYNSELYNYDLRVDGYYFGNAIALSSFEYVEENLEKDEIVVGFNYDKFCINNGITNCDEYYLKGLLVNKKIDNFDLIVKDIVYSEELVIMKNERFYKVLTNYIYSEYYFDIYKSDRDFLFYNVINNDYLSNFEFVKVGENDSYLRYKVEVNSNKKLNNINDYSDYIVCMNKGYDCDNYLNHLESIVQIDAFSGIAELSLKIIHSKLDTNEIAISTSLANKLNKGKGEEIIVYVKYDNLIVPCNLKITDIIEDSNYVIYQNSSWSYLFFKDIVGFNIEDLRYDKIIVFEDVKEGYVIDYNLYNEMVEEVERFMSNIKRTILSINKASTICSIVLLFVLELFFNKFKIEFLLFLESLNVEKKNALSIL